MDEKLLGRCEFYCGACPTYMQGDCRGCQEGQSDGDCYTSDCAEKKNLCFCGECECFPCDIIMTKPHTTILNLDWLRWKKRT